MISCGCRSGHGFVQVRVGVKQSVLSYGPKALSREKANPNLEKTKKTNKTKKKTQTSKKKEKPRQTEKTSKLRKHKKI